MRKTLILLTAGTAAIATPALAQLGGVAGQVTGNVTGNVAGQVDPAGTVGTITDQVTPQVGEVVDQTDDAVNSTDDAPDLTPATLEQARASANDNHKGGHNHSNRTSQNGGKR